MIRHRYTHAMLALAVAAGALFYGCQGNKESGAAGDAASRVYVAPGSYDEFYAFMSGGFSGQLSVYGLPSGRLFRVIPVFSQDPEKGWGYTEETIPMLNTSHGFIPWDDAHHPEFSMTDGVPDGRWIFINGNNTPRIARIDLTTFRTAEILEIPNSGGNHSSPFTTENTEYVVAGTRFSVPMFDNQDVPIDSYKQNFKGTVSFIKIDQTSGRMKLAFQILMPGFDYDLAHAGKGPSHDWMFFSSYNSEQANTMLEAEARRVMAEHHVEVTYEFGTMIEIPRAALTADRIAEYAHFFSFGTNDLTQTTFGISRDDAETGFLSEYLQKGILADNPFATIDEAGVGQLMAVAVKKGRATRPELDIGICGEHGGDPRSIAFCHRLGLDYVSCSPFRVPVARLAAAHAALKDRPPAVADFRRASRG